MRYIPHTPKDIEEMLKVIGVSSIEALFTSIPKELRLTKAIDLPTSLSELDLKNHLESIANRNEAQLYTSFLGAGCYSHFIPTIVNYLTQQGGYLTAYTPYQPEISQGTLQTTFEFQTMIARLTGMEVANASMYDGSTALAEACLMSKRLFPQKKTLLIAENVHPEYREICNTYVEAQDIELISMPYETKTGLINISELSKAVSTDTLGVIVQNPNFFGTLEDLGSIQKICNNVGALFIVAVTEPLSLAMIKSPGQFGADIVVGEAQSFGNPPSYGGPHVGFFATRLSYVRAIPGRIVGESVDNRGNRAFTLTLSTREQHIRREKATSNICTNQALFATRSTIYLSTVGEEGLKKVAKRNHALANLLAEKLELKFKAPFFNEVVVKLKKPIKEVEAFCHNEKIIPGLALEKFYPELKECLLVCTTELTDEDKIKELAELL